MAVAMRWRNGIFEPPWNRCKREPFHSAIHILSTAEKWLGGSIHRAITERGATGAKVARSLRLMFSMDRVGKCSYSDVAFRKERTFRLLLKI
jgi:hypothetical protein